MHLGFGDAARASATSIAAHHGESLDPGEHTGWFRRYFATGAWEWSDEVYHIHGRHPGEHISTPMVLSHIDSHDRRRFASALQAIRSDLSPFSMRLRVVDAGGDDHSAVIVADVLRDVDGAILGMQGFYIDVTGPERVAQKRITEQVAQIASRRIIIEQAKGMLMAVYGIDSEMAFEVLRRRSQATDVKVHAVAQQLVTNFASSGVRTDSTVRASIDAVFSTCPSRMTN